MYKGSCLCGQVQYEIDSELGEFIYCHCRSCRKASGSAHGANSPVPRSAFRLVHGANLIREFESSPGKFRAFCSNCGSPIYARKTNDPETVRVRLGSLDTPFVKTPKAHAFVGDKAAWAPITDDVPQFAGWPS